MILCKKCLEYVWVHSTYLNENKMFKSDDFWEDIYYCLSREFNISIFKFSLLLTPWIFNRNN